MDSEGFAAKTDRRAWGCWLWTGAQHERGYGRLRWHGKLRGAHRVAWEIHHGEPPPLEMMVLHTCDEPRCVNPDHLYLGTQADNMRDRRDRNRVPRANPVSISQAQSWIELNESQVKRAQARIAILRDWMQNVEHYPAGVDPGHD